MDEDELLREIRSHDVSEDPPEPPRAEPVVRARRAPPSLWERTPVWAKIGAVFAFLGAGVAFLLSGTGASEAFVYSKLVDEVMRAPDQFVGRELRVEGELQRGSVRFVDEPGCEHSFVLQREGLEMPVRFPRCVVPDTFRDDMPMPVNVVVQGQLQPNGTFLANEVIPRCASHYDEATGGNGQQPPHPIPAS